VHSYTGPTNVDSGATLAVNGTIASSQMLTINGTVAGTGTIGNTSVNAGGTIAPGNGGIGTLSVQGNLAMVAGSRFAAQIDGTGASDRITVTGAANISGATLDVSASGIALAGYTVLTTTGGLTGTFDVGPISAFIGVTANYDANNAYLDIEDARLRRRRRDPQSEGGCLRHPEHFGRQSVLHRQCALQCSAGIADRCRCPQRLRSGLG
jgi:uncharacterized protein with beta-barrel porin domain